MKRVLNGLKAAIGGTLLLLVAGPALADKHAPLAGGGCEYEGYPGRCQILSIAQGIEGREPYRALDIQFYYTPIGSVPPEYATNVIEQTEDGLYRLFLENGWRPGINFVRDNELEVFSVFSCKIEASVAGSCVPGALKVDGLQLNEYLD